MGFLSQWKVYFDQMPSSSNSEFKGRKLDPTVFERVRIAWILSCTAEYFLQMSEEQIVQLYELMHAVKDVWKPPLSDSPLGTQP